MYKTLLYSLVDNIATITFNRPTVMNAFDKTMADELEKLTEYVKSDPAIRVVMLNGAGELFMAGGDLLFFHESFDAKPKDVMKIIHTLNASILNLMTMPKPVVASVHGSVAGVGMSFMLASDLVIAADNTKFMTAYTNIGVSPDGGLTYHLPRVVGTKKAMELLLLSGIFDAATAQAYGLVNWVVAPEILAEETQRILKRLVLGPREAFASTKQLVRMARENSLETQLESEARAFAACAGTADFKKGVTAFLQKKKPNFDK